MLRMLGKLKRNAGWLFVTLALLFLQANCDLALPEYTSLIVDTGIQQKGIQDAVPETLREGTYELIMSVTAHDQRPLVEDNYKRDGDLYRLISEDQAQRDELADVMAESELILTFEIGRAHV